MRRCLAVFVVLCMVTSSVCYAVCYAASGDNIAPIAVGGGFYTYTRAGSSPSNLIDGNPNTSTNIDLWSSSGSFFVRREFPEPVRVNRVNLVLGASTGLYCLSSNLGTAGSWTSHDVRQGVDIGGGRYEFTWEMDTTAKFWVIQRYAQGSSSVPAWEWYIWEYGAVIDVDGISTTAGVELSWSEGTAPYEVLRNGVSVETGIMDTEYLDAAAPWGTALTYTVSDSAGATGIVLLSTLPASPVLSLDSVTTSQVSIHWVSVATATAYRVYRDGVFVTETTNLAFTDGNLAPSQTFVYKVSAVNAIGEGNKSSEIVATTSEQPPPPQAPTGLHVTSRGATVIGVAWTPITGVTGYKVYLGGVLQGLASAASHTFSSLSPGTQYSIAVQGYSGAYDGAISTPISVTTIGIPGSVQSLNGVPNPSSIALAWAAPSTPDTPTGYRVYRDGAPIGEASTTNYLVTGLDQLTEYTIGVSALTAAGEGPLAEITVTTTILNLAQPVGLSTSSSPRTMTLSWQPVEAAVFYKCYIAGQYMGQTAACKYVFKGLIPQTGYTVSVSAANQHGESDATATTATTGPGAAALTVSAYGAGYIARWNPPSPALDDMPDLYRFFVDETQVYTGLNSYAGDDSPGWEPSTVHDCTLEAVYGASVFTSTASVTSLSGGAVSGDDALVLAGFSIRSLWPLLAIVTALGIVWMTWDAIERLAGR